MSYVTLNLFLLKNKISSEEDQKEKDIVDIPRVKAWNIEGEKTKDRPFKESLAYSSEGSLEQRPAGWLGGIVLKNKLRNLKSRLKQWSKENGDVNINKIHHLRQKLNDIEDTASDRTLSEAKLMAKKSI